MAEKSNIKKEFNNATGGLNLDQTPNQIKKGQLTYALNASIENFEANSVNYQNEEGNTWCLDFPDGYFVIGKHFIPEKNKHVFFITNPTEGNSQIGYMDNNDCVYKTLISASCLNFDKDYPIHKVVHKITNCSTEIYWTDGINPRRHLDIDNVPETLAFGSALCDPNYSGQLDCNQLKLQPIFSIPTLSIEDVVSGGNLKSGTYQFTIQYSDVAGNPFTSYYSITNPTPISDPQLTTNDFDYVVGKSIVVKVEGLDDTGQFQYFNLAVIKTINGISSAELVGTYYIDNTTKNLTYSGQNVAAIDLAIEEIFEKYPYYEIAQDLTAVQDVLVWDNLSSIDRVNYQKIANNIKLQWETWRIPKTEGYQDEVNATNLREYLRDEVYPFEIVFLLDNGKQTDGFHIPGRVKNVAEESAPDVASTNPDFIGNPTYTIGDVGYSPYWKIYNTATVSGQSDGYDSSISYKGPHKFGEFAYWESQETYPCNEDVWGELSGKPIRHHKFPDVLVSPIFESESYSISGPISPVMRNTAIYPLGVKLDTQQINALIETSDLTAEQKSEIVGYKIVRGNRGTNKSIVAKGMLRNVGKYQREGTDYYFPNYPYNDLSPDPFLNTSNNAFSQLCSTYNINVKDLGDDNTVIVQYKDCNSNKESTINYTSLGNRELCSAERPTLLSPVGDEYATIGIAEYEVWRIWISCWAGDCAAACRGNRVRWIDPIEGEKTMWLSPNDTNDSGYGGCGKIIYAVPDTGGPIQASDDLGDPNLRRDMVDFVSPNSTCSGDVQSVNIKSDEDAKHRLVFNSPETSFGQPFLGDVLKVENVIFGGGKAHFVEVKDNAKYKLITPEAQIDSIKVANELGAISTDFDPNAFFVSYEAQLTILLGSVARKNYAYSYNSVADYNHSANVPNDLGIKQRKLDISRYMIPGVVSVGDDIDVNNYQRESSVFLKTDETATPLLYPSDVPELSGAFTDDSRFTISEKGSCDAPSNQEDIKVVSYYASIKNDIPNQWGQIYSYDTIDTGTQIMRSDTESSVTIFGGDTYISRFAYKTKLPFFIDNRVNAPDDSDVFYDEIGNIAYPKYWHSSRPITQDYVIGDGGNSYTLSNIISYKAHNFDCPNEQGGTDDTDVPGRAYFDGYYYLFAYGVPNFYCESSYNVDLRQAFNNKEGDFWPHVSTGIPDDWVQEMNVSIANDNTYTYNSTFSKQNKENTFTHLPIDWDKPCYTHYPFRAIYSDPQNIDSDNRINSWLIYRAVSYYDFPQNYGTLTSLDGIQNKAVLARFENKTLLYNNLLTIDTSNPQSAFLGNPNLFEGAPPIDFAETDLGYVGSQHKMLLKIPEGQITADAKRGQVFLVQGTKAVDISGFGSGMTRWLTDHLPFEMLKHFPDAEVDNNFTGMGLHGVYDSKYNRVIITKTDYVPINENITYDATTNKYYVEEEFDTESTTTTTTTTII